jgi:hypothetical protein
LGEYVKLLLTYPVVCDILGGEGMGMWRWKLQKVWLWSFYLLAVFFTGSKGPVM